MMCRAGKARAMAPPGSTASSERPATGPPKPCKNHHGTPFMAVSTTVCGPISGPTCCATVAKAGALTAITTRSCSPSAAASLEAFTGTVCNSPPWCNCKPCCCKACSVSPRASTLSCAPARAKCTPIQPPMAPAPTMAIFWNGISFILSFMHATPHRCDPPGAPGHQTHPVLHRGSG